MTSVIICGSTCGHDHNSLNGPTGCCPTHGPYLYFCSACHSQPKGSTVSDPAAAPDDLDVPTDGEPGPPCSRCGVPLPPLPVAVRRALNAGLAVDLSHPEGGCPTDDQRPKGRYFEVRVSIVEVDNVSDHPDLEELNVVELMSFKHGVRADDLDAAMRPLATGLGEKWTAGEKQARIADAAATTTVDGA